MSENISINNQKAIIELQKNYAITEVKLDGITKDILEIKNNHLMHINDNLATLNSLIASNQVEMTKLINEKINDVYAQLANLRVTDAKREPGNTLLMKIIEYVMLAVASAGVAYLISEH